MGLIIDEEPKRQKKIKISLITQSVIQIGILLWFSLIGIFLILLVLFTMTRNMPIYGIPISVSKDKAEILSLLSNHWGWRNETPIQIFVIFCRNLITGNLGESFYIQRGTLVNEIISRAFYQSFELNLLSFGFSLPIGLVLGVYAYKFRDRRYGLIFQAIKRLNLAIPILCLSLLLQFISVIKFPLLPATGYKHLVLPVICMGVIMLPFITSLTYSIIDFYKSPKKMHVLSVKIGFYLSLILSSNLLVETIFKLNGIGSLTIDSINSEDYSVTNAAIYNILLIFFIINISINLLLHTIRIIIELVKNSKKIER